MSSRIEAYYYSESGRPSSPTMIQFETANKGRAEIYEECKGATPAGHYLSRIEFIESSECEDDVQKTTVIWREWGEWEPAADDVILFDSNQKV